MEKNNQPLVSIVIPCYNHEQFVQDCIQSVIDQTYKNIELIIIDDGSKDSSVEKIHQMISECEKRFTRFEFRTRPNKGLSATLNEALDWCLGKYYSVIASDDIMYKNKTEKQVAYLEVNNKIIAVFGGVELIDNYGKFDKIMQNTAVAKYSFEDIILHNCHIFAPTQMVRMHAIKDVGGYKAEIILEDWYIWLKLAKNGDLIVLPEVFSKYRMHSNNTVKQYLRMHAGRLQILAQYKNLPIYKNALFNVIWMNGYELIKFGNKNKIIVISSIFFKDPIRFLKRIKNKFFKKSI